MCLRRKKKGKSKVLSGVIQKPSRGHYNSCIFIAQSQTVTLQPNSYSESNKQSTQDRTLDLPFFFRYKHPTSLKNLPSAAPSASYSYWFQGNFAAVFILT